MTIVRLPPHFELGPKIGNGSLGEVYRARNVFTGRDYAFKIIFPELAQDGILIRRLRREARAVLRLRHPNVITVYDCGMLADGRLYVASEYVAGDSLATLIRRRRPPLEVRDGLVLLQKLAQALAHAHDRGVIHRDLRPENILVYRSDARLSCKLVDFGFAKIVDARYMETFNISAAGSPSVRSVEYGAPEQLRGAVIDHRSDIYALGCIAFALLTNGPPFQGQRVGDVGKLHLSAAPPLLSTRMADSAELARAMDPIVSRCLEKNPAKRYQSASELATAIGEVLSHADDARAMVKVGPNRRTLLLRDLAQELVDEGYCDLETVIALAAVSTSIVELQQCEQMETTLKKVRQDLEYDARAREGHLRVTIGQLTGARGNSQDATITADAERLIAEYADQIVDAYRSAAEECEQVDPRLLAIERRKHNVSERLKDESGRLDRCMAARLPTIEPRTAEIERLLSEVYPTHFPMVR